MAPPHLICANHAIRSPASTTSACCTCGHRSEILTAACWISKPKTTRCACRSSVSDKPSPASSRSAVSAIAERQPPDGQQGLLISELYAGYLSGDFPPTKCSCPQLQPIWSVRLGQSIREG